MKDMNYTDSCNCLPACISLDYDVATSQSDWNWPKLYNVLKQTKSWDEDDNEILESDYFRPHLTQLTVFFKDMQFITSERNEWQGYTDFWANIGGIIGLFTGFSFITMFEIFYYLSLRIYCNIKMFGRRHWSGLEE
ncbi:hypothetical protein ILUMI_02376 [Ignelater luminosus]|uniref:Uncharacterized protein n=1 Tax=Ignelater luminosus TaxID=2038154 RepID=A0A8K0DGL2_IGNLU|nr:hypothetical protein ILUMI_02376 [Ignelater luminosus]